MSKVAFGSQSEIVKTVTVYTGNEVAVADTVI
jgi:hypothetical protein